MPNLFIERPTPDPEKIIEIVCSSGKRETGSTNPTKAIRLFSHTLNVDPTQMTEWPQTTEACCWWCTEQFGTTPVCVPKKRYDETDVFEVFGVFCGGACGMAYIMDKMSSDKYQVMMDFRYLLINVFRCDAPSVFVMKSAPPRESLIKFLGHLTIGEFRLAAVTADLRLITPPFVSYQMVVQDNSETQQEQNHQIRGLRRPTNLPPTGRMSRGALLVTEQVNPPPPDESQAKDVEMMDETGVCNNLPQGGEFTAFLASKEVETAEEGAAPHEKAEVAPALRKLMSGTGRRKRNRG